MTSIVATLGTAAAVMLVAASAARHLHSPRLTPPAHPRRRRHDVGPAEWARLLDDISSEVRSGSSIDTAWREAWQRHDLAGRVLHRGSTWRDVDPARCTPDEAIVVHVVTAAAHIGGAVAATIDAGAALLRERAAMHADARAQSAQARLSAQVLTAVPIVFAGWSLATSASVRAASTTAPGLVAVTAGSLCNLAGWRWMRRIVERASR